MPTYYSLTPPEDGDCLTIDEVVSRVADTFPQHDINAQAAQADAKRRLTALQAVNAPEEMLRIYRDGKPVRCRITEPETEQYLEFDVWENQGMHAYPFPTGVDKCGFALASKLAELLGYRLTCESYD